MAAKVKSDSSGLIAKLRDLKTWKGITLEEAVRRHARMCAVELCRRTQPFGKDNTVKQIGENAIERDIRKIYKDSANLLNMAKGWSDSPWQRAVVHALETEAYDALWVLLQETKNWLQDKVVDGPDPAIHKASRDRRGRVRRKSRYFFIVKDAASLVRYIRDKQMLVGFSKSVWWTIAQQIKTDLKRASEGFPAWVRRHKGPGHAFDFVSSNKKMVMMTTDLPWMDTILPSYEREAAVRIVQEKLIKYIEYTWKGELRKRAKAATRLQRAA